MVTMGANVALSVVLLNHSFCIVSCKWFPGLSSLISSDFTWTFYMEHNATYQDMYSEFFPNRFARFFRLKVFSAALAIVIVIYCNYDNYHDWVVIQISKFMYILLRKKKVKVVVAFFMNIDDMHNGKYEKRLVLTLNFGI